MKKLHKVYNLGNSKSESLLEFIKLIEKNLNKKAKKNFLPLQPGDVPATFADISESTRDLKFIPKVKLYNKVILSSKYQIKHVNGLTFDFLFNIAKLLHEKESFMIMGGGKGDEPLVFNDGGKPYRSFLEGRIKDKSYCLILHLSNQELKGI